VKGGKMYVDYKIEYSEVVFKLPDEGAHVYFCALRGMTPEIQHTFKSCQSKGRNFGNEAKLHSLRGSSGNVKVSINLITDCYCNKSSWLNKRKHKLQIITPIMGSTFSFFFAQLVEHVVGNNGF
jgi:hypothetical protein